MEAWVQEFQFVQGRKFNNVKTVAWHVIGYDNLIMWFWKQAQYSKFLYKGLVVVYVLSSIRDIYLGFDLIYMYSDDFQNSISVCKNFSNWMRCYK